VSSFRLNQTGYCFISKATNSTRLALPPEWTVQKKYQRTGCLSVPFWQRKFAAAFSLKDPSKTRSKLHIVLYFSLTVKSDVSIFYILKAEKPSVLLFTTLFKESVRQVYHYTAGCIISGSKNKKSSRASLHMRPLMRPTEKQDGKPRKRKRNSKNSSYNVKGQWKMASFVV